MLANNHYKPIRPDREYAVNLVGEKLRICVNIDWLKRDESFISGEYDAGLKVDDVGLI